MPVRSSPPFYPERILWTGVVVLGGSLVIGAPFLWFVSQQSPIVQGVAMGRKLASANKDDLSFSFSVKESSISLPLPHIEQELTFSFDPPRPGGQARLSDIFIRCKQSAQSKRISLPCRLDLHYLEGDQLGFSDGESPFWVDLSLSAGGQIQAVVWIETPSKEKLETERFVANLQESPIQGPKEFAEGSPFRVLAEARWLGQDVFSEKYVGGLSSQRIGIEAPPKGDILEFQEGDWLVWNEGRWTKGIPMEGQKPPMARIASVDSKALILEGWNGESHVRLSLPLTPVPPSKARAEEIFNSIRIRSERQISCMMEKQCLILRCGDWVLKADGRWKILRKVDEKEAYKAGKILGELFVFEKIESKQGQKFIQGFLFNPEKTQSIPVDMAANKHAIRKSKGRLK